MIKLTLALVAFVLTLVIPAAYAVTSRPPSETIAQTLLRQMNSGPDGRITRRVDCALASRAKRMYACTLESVASTRLGVRVAVVDGGLRTTWHALEG
jgi:hypothetical protein